MSDLSNKIIADLKAELAESKAAANRVTESMGSEILRLQGDLERQRSLAVAAIEDAQQQRTRAEAAEQELRAEKQRGNSAWDDGYAKSLARAKAAEAVLGAVTRHRDDLLALVKRDCEVMAATGVKENLLRDAIPVLAQQRDEAMAKLAAIRAHLAGVDLIRLSHLSEFDSLTIDEHVSLIAAAREALEP